jgi:hypothetical protein
LGDAVKETLSAHKHLIAAADHWMWESLFFYHAKKSGINSLVIQHGFIADFCVPFLAKKYAVWGSFDKDLMISRGVNEASVVLAGAPHFDQFAEKHGTTYDKVKNQYITFFAQPYFKYPYLGTGKYAESLNWLIALQEKVQAYGKTLQIRLHPLDNRTDYETLLPNIKIANGSLSETIIESCLAITIDSAVAFECGMANLPLIQLYNGFDRFMDMSEHYSRKVSSEKELTSLVSQWLSEKSDFESEQKRQNAGLTFYLTNRGESSRKIIEYCE